jgi:twitching motility protein PilI
MANRQALRELQQRLAERMQAARDQTLIANWLAVECAGAGLLFSLRQASEIFSTVPIHSVPYAKPWLAGVANLRGGLYTVVDLSVYLGLRESTNARTYSSQSRLVSLHNDLGLNCALLVDRLLGLRSDEQLPVEAEAAEVVSARPRFAGTLRRDASGRTWRQIDLEAMSRQERFLQVVA